MRQSEGDAIPDSGSNRHISRQTINDEREEKNCAVNITVIPENSYQRREVDKEGGTMANERANSRDKWMKTHQG